MSGGTAIRKRTGSQGATLRDSLARRLDLLRQSAPEHAGGPALRHFVAEAFAFTEPVRRLFRPGLDISAAAEPKLVVLLPGFATHPARMKHMARQLERAGHKVKRWGMGWNMGPTQDTIDILERRIEQVSQRYGKQVVLVGWSLGGVFAREVAKRHPQLVSKVITMGSPFSGTPYDNNVWRVYQLVTGHSVEAPPIEVRVSEKPPVETIALWSPRDGIVSPRASCGKPGERDRAVSLRCSHIGFSNSPECIRFLLQELDPS